MYFDDVAGNPVRWARDGKAAAASPDSVVFGEILGLLDIILAAATGQTTTVVKKNDSPISVLLNADHLSSIVARPMVGIVYFPGQKCTMVQVA